MSPHVRESKTILDSEFHVVDPRFQSLVAFRISLSYIPDSKAQDPNSTRKISRIPDIISKKYFRDSGFGFSCIARALGSWQIRLLFPPRKGGGGVAYSWEFLVRVCRPVLQILTLFQTKKCHFPYPFSDLAFRQKLFYNYID